MKNLWLVIPLALALAGCGIVYEQDIQQGNILKQEQIDRLKPGMTRRQVQLLLGTPAIRDPFHRNRWDYVAYVIPEGEEMQELMQLTLFFEGNKLVRIKGTMKPSEANLITERYIDEQVEDVMSDGDSEADG